MSPYVEETIKELARIRGTSHSAVVEEMVRIYGRKMIAQVQKEMETLVNEQKAFAEQQATIRTTLEEEAKRMKTLPPFRVKKGGSAS
jgi:hypothetical protein